MEWPLGVLRKLAGDVVGVGNRLAAKCPSFSGDFVGRRGIVSAAVVVAAAIVHDESSAFVGHEQRVLASEAATRTGDDDHTPVK